MTCIVGMEFQDRVYIAGDIQGTGWNYKVVHTTPKVFSKCGVTEGDRDEPLNCPGQTPQGVFFVA